jgi:hypothetical protein
VVSSMETGRFELSLLQFGQISDIACSYTAYSTAATHLTGRLDNTSELCARRRASRLYCCLFACVELTARGRATWAKSNDEKTQQPSFHLGTPKNIAHHTTITSTYKY